MAEETTFDNMGEDLFETLGRDATYKPLTGSNVTCKVNLEKEIDPQPIGSESQAWASRLTLEYRLAEVGLQANRGDIFQIGSDQYRVQSVIEGDERFVKVAIKQIAN